MYLKRRAFLRLAASVSLGLAAGPLVAACASAPATPTQTRSPTAARIRFGVIGSGLPVTQSGVRLGSFERQGLAVEIVQQRGGAEAIQALTGGAIDVFDGDFSHTLDLNHSGREVRVICETSDRFVYTLIGAKSAAPGVAQLRNQKIGITSPRSLADNGMRWLLKTHQSGSRHGRRVACNWHRLATGCSVTERAYPRGHGARADGDSTAA